MTEQIWVTAKGERIKIKDLSDSHLLNIINKKSWFVSPDVDVKLFRERLEACKWEGLNRGISEKLCNVIHPSELKRYFNSQAEHDWQWK